MNLTLKYLISRLTTSTLVFGLLIFLLPQSTVAQSSEGTNHSIIHYKDGSVFIGDILYKDRYEVVLWGTTQDTLHLTWSNIKRLQDADDILLFNKGKFHLKRGFFGATALSFAAGQRITEASALVGNRISDRFAVGGGAAISTGEIVINNRWFWHDFHTYFAYGRFYLNNSKRRLFVDTRVGYGFPRNGGWNDQHNGGFHLQPGISLIFPSRNNLRFFISLSQYFQYTSGEISGTDGFLTEYVATYDLYYNRTMIKLGFQFK